MLAGVLLAVTLQQAVDVPAVSPCVTFCRNVESGCTGSNTQFASTDACIGVCEKFPRAGPTQEADGGQEGGEMEVNSLECRMFFAERTFILDSAEERRASCQQASNPGRWMGERMLQ